MNPAALHSALSSTAKGTTRLALIVMAIHADHRGRIAISARDLGEMCGVSPQAASETLGKLVGSKAVKLVEKGEGQRPSVYLFASALPQLATRPLEIAATREAAKEIMGDTFDYKELVITTGQKPVSNFTPKVEPEPQADTPKPAPSPEFPVPPWAPRNAVGQVLGAARANPHPDMPFYWHRTEHAQDLERACFAAKITKQQLCERLMRREPIPQPRNMAELVEAAKEVK